MLSVEGLGHDATVKGIRPQLPQMNATKADIVVLDNTCHKSPWTTSFRALDAQPTTSTNMYRNKSNNSRPTIESGGDMIKADMLKNLGSIAQSGTKDITKVRGSPKDVESRRREKRTRTEQLATKRWDSEIKSERLACELMADIIIC